MGVSPLIIIGSHTVFVESQADKDLWWKFMIQEKGENSSESNNGANVSWNINCYR